jgi:hypothetical protein
MSRLDDLTQRWESNRENVKQLAQSFGLQLKLSSAGAFAGDTKELDTHSSLNCLMLPQGEKEKGARAALFET